MNKEWTADSRITDRFIYNEALGIKNTLLKQEQGKGRLYQLTSLFKTLNKVELIDVSTIEACGIDIDCRIKRSKDKLPKIIESAGGPVIKYVASVDGSNQVFVTTETSWTRKVSVNDPHAKGDLITYLKDDYLYLPNVEWDFVKIEAIFEDPDLIDSLNSCKDELDCRSAYERTFPLPNYLDKSLKDLLNENLLRYYHRIRQDVTTNKNPLT